MEKRSLMMVLLLFVIGVLNVSMSRSILSQESVSENGNSSQSSVMCEQVFRFDSWFDPEDFCYHEIERRDCWSGGWDLDCEEGIVYTLDCPEEEPIVVGSFSLATGCKEPS